METTTERNYINIEDEMRRSYLDYAMSVIIGRALPDVRDGLKPVHRRVLWAMHELGNQYNKPYKKSARVVGDCFVKGTLVHTEHGLKPIEEIETGERLQMPNGYTSEVVARYHNPPAPVVSVRLANGNRMTVTPGQLFRVLEDDLSIAWERADNLVGKRVLVSSPRALGIPSALHEIADRTAAAYIAGLLVAEGYLTDRGRSHRVGIQMVDREPLEFVAAYYQAQGIKASWQRRAPQQPHHREQHGLRFSGSAEAYDVCVDTSAHKRVPAWVLADRRLFASFLAGFTDGDGHIRLQEAKREALLVSTSETLLRQIQTMLADCGIHGHLSYEDFANRTYGQNCSPRFMLCMTGDNASRFCALIADHVRVSRKREFALRFAAWTRRTTNTETECVPSRVIFEELSRHHLGGGWFVDTQGNKFRAGIKYATGAKIRYPADLHEKELSYRQIESWGILTKLERIGSPLAVRLKDLISTYCVLRVEAV
ncbi:MAG TPA: DNA gyrase subunit A, partial [Pyrinomonadaceae bacterium]|nr:DNA gyrase subunit A [Pyrinomonadaceae bacterium]